MKKYLSLLTISTLSTSALPTVGLVLNSSVVKNLNLKDTPVKDNSFMYQPKGIPDDVIFTKVCFAPDGTIWVGAKGGLYKSKPNGSFEHITSGIPSNVYINTITYTPNGTVWVGTTNGLYKSKPDNSFEHINVINGEINEIKISFTKVIWVATKNGLYKSSDGTNFNFIQTPDSNITTLLISPNGTVYAGTDDGLYYSVNGDSFTNVSGIPGINISTLLFSPNGNVYVGTTSGLYYSVDGNKYKPISIIGNNPISGLTITPSGTIWVGSNNTLYKSTDGKIFNQDVNFPTLSKTDSFESFDTNPNGNVYVGTTSGLYYSVDGNPFTKAKCLSDTNKWITGVFFAPGGAIWVGTTNGLYKINIIDNLITSKQPNYCGPKYNGFVYNKEQTIDLKKDYLKNATLDGQTISVSSTQHITVGKHSLVLTVKDEAQQYLDLFGGDTSTGIITYNFWVKTAIDSNTEFNYSTITHDTDLLTGLVSNAGNTKGCPIIQTQQKSGSGVVSLTTTITSNMIDLNKSWYVKGTVDTSKNDFNENSSTKKPVPKDLSITTDGIYHLHLVDVVGNVYDSYLELGQANWQLHGDFDDATLKQLETQLNVSVNVSNPNDKQIAMTWLNQYKTDVANDIQKTVSDKGKGFDSIINNYITQDKFNQFLDHVSYTVASHHEAINQDKLNQMVSNLANQALSDGLNKLPKDLNVDTSNVVNKQTLDSYSSWVTGYQDFINTNKNQWFKNVSDIASRGFATSAQMQQINQYLNGLTFSNYLQHVKWTPTTMLGAGNPYQQFVELDKLQADTIAWVNQNIPAINQAYQSALSQAESSINYHGYKLSDLLGNNQLPQTKSQIENYKDGLGFHDWLQAQANSKYHSWQLKMGLGLGLGIPFIIGVLYFIAHKVWIYPAIRRKRRRNFYSSNNEAK